MGALGAFKYCWADERQRADLEWFCNPWVWGIALALGALLAVKSTGKVALGPLTAPLDSVEHALRHTAMPIAGISAALPVSLKAISAYESALNFPAVGAGSVMHASLVPVESLPGWGLAIAITVGLFSVVWMTFNAIDTLAMLCPFGPVELITRMIKCSVLVVILASTVISPVLGLLVCAIIILVSTKVAGWAYRLTVFGLVLMHDLILPRAAQRAVDTQNPHAFVKCKRLQIPARTYGRLKYENGALSFRYRPFFFTPTKSVELPPNPRYIVKGFFVDAINDSDVNQTTGKSKKLCRIMLPPRYRRHEEALSHSLGIQEIRDSTLLKGWKAFKLWLTGSWPAGSNNVSNIQRPA